MAYISLTATRTSLGYTDRPREIGAAIEQRPWPGGGTVSHLALYIGYDTVVVWPAEPDVMENLAEKLVQLAKEERQRRGK